MKKTLFLVAILLTTCSLSAQLEPMIQSVVANAQNTAITINGSQFNSGVMPAITLSGTPLTVTSYSSSMVTASLPNGVQPGTYQLQLRYGYYGFDQMYVTLGAQGAVGPQGPPGPQGAQGAEGLQGAMGIIGAQGQQGPTGGQGPQYFEGNMTMPATFTYDVIGSPNGLSYGVDTGLGGSQLPFAIPVALTCTGFNFTTSVYGAQNTSSAIFGLFQGTATQIATYTDISTNLFCQVSANNGATVSCSTPFSSSLLAGDLLVFGTTVFQAGHGSDYDNASVLFGYICQ